MSNAIIQLLVLAGIAIFLILRLRNVLGTREGFEKPQVSPAGPTPVAARRDFDVIEGGPDHDITDQVPEDSDAARAFAAMKLVEPAFNLSQFLQGARGAYEMILTAFDKGDLDKIRPFLSPDVYSSFADVVRARSEKGLTVDSTFLGLRELSVAEAEFDRATNEAEISVNFVGELVSVVRDGSGAIIEGNPKVSRKQRDQWTFARKMGSSDPNWHLVATGG